MSNSASNIEYVNDSMTQVIELKIRVCSLRQSLTEVMLYDFCDIGVIT